MNFKGNIIKLWNELPSLLVGNHGVTNILCKDPFLSKMIKDQLKQNRPNLIGVFAHDIDAAWIMDKFFELSLFVDNSTYYIYNSENLKKDSLEKLSEVDQELFLHSSKKMKEAIPNLWEITNFAPWEEGLIFDFFEIIFKLEISRDFRSMFQHHNLQNSREIYDTLNLIKMSDGDFKRPQDVMSFENSSFNSFKVIDIFLENKVKDFYSLLASLIQIEKWEEARSVIMILKTMLLKYDEVLLKSKANQKLTKYDNNILGLRKKFTENQVSQMVKEFSIFEILLKKRDESLMSCFRLKQI